MNVLDRHRDAEALMGRADVAERFGNTAEALRYRSQAAQIEDSVFAQIDPTKVVTRGAIAVSAAALFYKAGQYAEAIRSAHRSLGSGPLPQSDQIELEEIIQRCRQLLTLREGTGKVVGAWLEIKLAGGEVGYGYASATAVTDRVTNLVSFLYRTTEWLLRRPIRTSGRVSDQVKSQCRPVVSTAAAGSFRFGLHLADPAPAQEPLSLFTGREGLDRVVQTSFEVVSAVGQDDFGTLERIVEEENYRSAFIQHARQLAPDGVLVGSVEVTRQGLGSTERAILTAVSRQTISQYLARASIPSQIESAIRIDTISGTLRALDLDRQTVRVDIMPGKSQVCLIDRAIVLDDIVGPMVNRRVRIPGYWQTRGSSSVFILTDIQLAESEKSVPSF